MESPMTLELAFDTLYRPLRLRGKSDRTVKLYGCLFRAFARWLGRPATVADLEDLLVSRYLEERAAKLSPMTVERERVQLCALARLLAERRVIAFPLTVRAGRLPERVPEAWSLEELARLVEAAKATPAVTRGGVVLRELLPPLISVLWETGERVWAAMEARPEDYRRPHLLLRAEARKGSKRDRVYTLSPATCDAIERIIAPGEPRIFRWPHEKSSLWHHLRQVMKAAGLRHGKKRVGFHQIRRTACTHFAAAGGDPQWFLDHEALKTTRRWYIDPRYVESHRPPCEVLPAIPTSAPPAESRA